MQLFRYESWPAILPDSWLVHLAYPCFLSNQLAAKANAPSDNPLPSQRSSALPVDDSRFWCRKPHAHSHSLLTHPEKRELLPWHRRLLCSDAVRAQTWQVGSAPPLRQAGSRWTLLRPAMG